jgi:hypothetical protein
MLTLSGVAAVGQAIPSATVSAKCQIGSGSATTDGKGAYILTIVGGVAPCILQLVENEKCVLNAESKSSLICVLLFGSPAHHMKLHSVATESGSVVNITTLTDMVTTRLLLEDPSAYFATFKADSFSDKAKTEKIGLAETEVVKGLEGIIALNGTGLISTPLIASTRSDAGNEHDKLLDELGKKLPLHKMSQVNWWLSKTFSTPDSLQALVLALAEDKQQEINQDPQGFWSGPSSYGSTVNAVVLDTGEVWGVYLSDSIVTGALYGITTVNGDVITMSGKSFSFSSNSGLQGVLTGPVKPKSTMSLKSGGGTVSASLTYSPAYETPANITRLGGTWSYEGRSKDSLLAKGEFTINNSGTFTLNWESCAANITITPHAGGNAGGKNVYDTKISSTGGGCAAGHGMLTGVAYPMASDRLVIIASNPSKNDGLIIVAKKQ